MNAYPTTARRRLTNLAGVALLSTLLAASASGAESRVRDGGNFFSKEVAAKVAADLDGLASARNASVIVETFDAAPPQITEQMKTADANARSAAYVAYGKARAAELKADFYIFATKQPPQVRTQTQPKAHEVGLSNEERDQVTAKLVDGFKARDFDRGLTDAVGVLKAGFAGTAPAAQPGVVSQTNAGQSSPRAADAPVPADAPRRERSSGSGMIGWILLAGVFLVVFMIIKAIRNAAANRMGGGYGPQGAQGMNQPGYGQPGYGQPGYGQQGGGGGFGRGIMGGLLGGMAGGYLANRAFGQGNDPANDPAAGDPVAGGGGLFGDQAGDGTEFGDSGGADFGGDAGGGDFGGGGDSGGGDF